MKRANELYEIYGCFVWNFSIRKFGEFSFRVICFISYKSVYIISNLNNKKKFKDQISSRFLGIVYKFHLTL